jgi:hypothetical protein
MPFQDRAGSGSERGVRLGQNLGTVKIVAYGGFLPAKRNHPVAPGVRLRQGFCCTKNYRTVAEREKPMDALATDISVRRRLREGWYIYTCEAIPGLFIASKDDRKAYEDVPKAIKLLFRLDWGVEVSVAHKVGYDAFFGKIRLGERAVSAVQDRTNDLMENHEITMIPFIVGTTNDLSSRRNGRPN